MKSLQLYKTAIATEEELVHEAFECAVVRKLETFFVNCESSPIEVALGHFLKGIAIDRAARDRVIAALAALAPKPAKRRITRMKKET